eukprot:907795-Rhodomonas_salina.1
MLVPGQEFSYDATRHIGTYRRKSSSPNFNLSAWSFRYLHRRLPARYLCAQPSGVAACLLYEPRRLRAPRAVGLS